MNDVPLLERQHTRPVLRWTIAAFYTVGGIAHLTVPDTMLAIVPSWVPYPRDVVLITGWLELAGAAALVTAPLRRAAAVAFALYALCVWPANIKHAMDAVEPLTWLYHGPRQILQPILIWCTLFSGGVIDWPIRGADKH